MKVMRQFEDKESPNIELCYLPMELEHSTFHASSDAFTIQGGPMSLEVQRFFGREVIIMAWLFYPLGYRMEFNFQLLPFSGSWKVSLIPCRSKSQSCNYKVRGSSMVDSFQFLLIKTQAESEGLQHNKYILITRGILIDLLRFRSKDKINAFLHNRVCSGLCYSFFITN